MPPSLLSTWPPPLTIVRRKGPDAPNRNRATQCLLWSMTTVACGLVPWPALEHGTRCGHGCQADGGASIEGGGTRLAGTAQRAGAGGHGARAPADDAEPQRPCLAITLVADPQYRHRVGAGIAGSIAELAHRVAPPGPELAARVHGERMTPAGGDGPDSAEASDLPRPELL